MTKSKYHYDPSTESIKDSNGNTVIDEVPYHLGDMLAELMTKTQWPTGVDVNTNEKVDRVER